MKLGHRRKDHMGGDTALKGAFSAIVNLNLREDLFEALEHRTPEPSILSVPVRVQPAAVMSY